ncbi:MAG TPA: flagellar hook capping FlgD N-terminal domain-containing protein [Bacteriovoracaceae bacterium]|nr:flagellar hook capping FlgD N-terminal domain-containing protein [Bacteriovoracaceae bacterium]
MPEIGRPVTNQQVQYSQVEIGPKSLAGSNGKSEKQIKEDIINKATGYKPKSTLYKEGDHNKMGKDEFMKLLTFQLQNQDPMNPMDQSKLTGELAQFSQLEQLTALNSKFDKTNQNQAIEDKFYAASFVGKKVVTHGSTITLKESGDPGDILFKLDGRAAKVMVRVLDEKNNVVGEMWQEGLSAGAHQATWDGVQLDGAPAVKGNYRAQVKAWDEKGNEVGTKTEATGIVQSVTFDEGEPVLSVNGQKVYLRDVASFHTANTETHSAASLTGLSDQVAPMVQSSKNVQVNKALDAYSENAGIYE